MVFQISLFTKGTLSLLQFAGLRYFSSVAFSFESDSFFENRWFTSSANELDSGLLVSSLASSSCSSSFSNSSSDLEIENVSSSSALSSMSDSELEQCVLFRFSQPFVGASGFSREVYGDSWIDDLAATVRSRFVMREVSFWNRPSHQVLKFLSLWRVFLRTSKRVRINNHTEWPINPDSAGKKVPDLVADASQRGAKPTRTVGCTAAVMHASTSNQVLSLVIKRKQRLSLLCLLIPPPPPPPPPPPQPHEPSHEHTEYFANWPVLPLARTSRVIWWLNQ